MKHENGNGWKTKNAVYDYCLYYFMVTQYIRQTVSNITINIHLNHDFTALYRIIGHQYIYIKYLTMISLNKMMNYRGTHHIRIISKIL